MLKLAGDVLHVRDEFSDIGCCQESTEKRAADRARAKGLLLSSTSIASGRRRSGCLNGACLQPWFRGRTPAGTAAATSTSASTAAG